MNHYFSIEFFVFSGLTAPSWGSKSSQNVVLERNFEPPGGSWRLPEDSGSHLEELLEALGTLLEWPKEGEGDRGELEESSGGARGELRERSSRARGGGGEVKPFPLAKLTKGIQVSKGIQGFKGLNKLF